MMNSEWKKFLLQWILPVAIFGIVMSIMFSGFATNIKEKIAEDYRRQLVSAVDDYATDFAAACKQVENLNKGAANVIDALNLKDDAVVASLSAIVDFSEAYMSFLAHDNGMAITNLGEAYDFSQVTYYSEIFADNSTPFHFVENDAIMMNPAIIVTTPVPNSNGTQKIFSYYPMNVSSFKKIVHADSDYDPKAFSILTDSIGTIVNSTIQEDGFVPGDNIWETLANKSSTPTDVRKSKTRVNAGNSGSFVTYLLNEGYVVCFVPIEETGNILLVGFTNNVVKEANDRSFQMFGQKLVWLSIVVVIFIIVITIINIIRIVIESRNTEDLMDMADTDQLTGLKNKIATEREIKSYIEEHPDALAMMFIIDIDNFKKINDTMGHAFGDEVLRELGRHIGINFRVSDVIGRTGGDEFTIFLKNLKEDANTIREAQKLVYFFKHFQVGDYVKYSVTASIGAAVFPTHGADFEALYKAADQAVYKSKKRGKNQLSFYDDRDKTPEEVAEADSHLIDIERKEETPIEC